MALILTPRVKEIRLKQKGVYFCKDGFIRVLALALQRSKSDDPTVYEKIDGRHSRTAHSHFDSGRIPGFGCTRPDEADHTRELPRDGKNSLHGGGGLEPIHR